MVLIKFELKSYFRVREIVENKTIYPHALSKKQFSSYCIFPTTIYNFFVSYVTYQAMHSPSPQNCILLLHSCSFMLRLN